MSTPFQSVAMSSSCRWVGVLVVWLFASAVVTINATSVREWAQTLAAQLHQRFDLATKHHDIVKVFGKFVDTDVFDPHAELRMARERIELYLNERAKMAWDAKVSLEARELHNTSDVDVNDDNSQDFVRFFDAKLESDAAVIASHNHLGESFNVNATRTFIMAPNVNFYGINTSSMVSAVHVPTPVYRRRPYLLRRIEWSNIDQVYRRNRERMKDLSFQKFCSESAFMRYYPAAPWRYDQPGLDLFDCRSTEWYIDAATQSKNVLIMLDLSGSMLGQRFEIAKQTIESLMETLFDNDFFNVLVFSKSAQFLDDCASDGLIQATMRNKKLIWSRLSNVTSEGKADYERALVKAFSTLMQLPPNLIQWRTKEELAQEREKQMLDPDMEYIPMSESVLVLPKNYVEMARNSSNSKEKMGCNDMIMLVTDGAPGFYKDIFQFYNKNRATRLFSFLVGEEATDFEQVRYMACANRGFMVHISNLADIQEKVQSYVRVLSRTITAHSTSIDQRSAVWSSIARERMSREFVISVGYPVVVDNSFMGVSAVSIPLVELRQLAHSSRIGPQSYFFMLDNSGYAMFHPQLDPFDEATGDIKPMFNNLDFGEIEVSAPMTPQPELGFINCESHHLGQLTVLFSVENLRRVYTQKNTYMAECVSATSFTLGLAVAEHEEVRVKRKGRLEWSSIDVAWMEAPNWRLHPKWRYCLLNDSDTELGPERAFAVYARQMRAHSRLPPLCAAREHLVDRVLLDLQATASLDSTWELEFTKNRQNGINLIWLATPSGLTRFTNLTLDGYAYYRPSRVGTPTTRGYKNYVLDLHPASVEEEYYKRAVRQKGRIVVDLNRESHLWHATGERESHHGNAENVSLLAVAYKAIYTNDALLGVVGIEFLYDRLIEQMHDLGCNSKSNERRCYLIDEHAYIVYSSQPDVHYAETFGVGGGRVLGAFFGQLDRVSEWTMELLIKKGFYTETTYYDNQAMCEQLAPTVAFSLALKVDDYCWMMFSNCLQPFRELLAVVAWFIEGMVRLLARFSLLSASSSALLGGVPTTEAFTTSFHPTAGRLPCRTKSKFYIANPGRVGSPSASLLEENYAERPCKMNAAQCAVKVFASFVEGTNLLMVVIEQGARSSCYDNKNCPLSYPRTVPFGFTRITPAEQRARDQPPGSGVGHAATDQSEASGTISQCPSTAPRRRQNVVQCLHEQIEDEQLKLPCSHASRLSLFAFVLLLCVLRLLC